MEERMHCLSLGKEKIYYYVLPITNPRRVCNNNVAHATVAIGCKNPDGAMTIWMMTPFHFKKDKAISLWTWLQTLGQMVSMKSIFFLHKNMNEKCIMSNRKNCILFILFRGHLGHIQYI
jgi:hypothetical protein